ncbi:pyrroloquinoline quinone biosynthesis protein PqqB [Ketobacter sp. MCCC 1A13808]|uniref:pyrroloquinoline quinone biosynthesis protein PqqB n=1 Tax=Ketobacter sp. MCCC 1A13808 TaxID=2602738 RepID=UPI0012EC342B|nr:pyrroloquinoline quinone biosynthesis protein PqqB [Ketobacter sp. MCCC 1A13808]MVF13220.1 pyrroloquinoline quinone biosynthesis protein PqqB [Ketobacter sp. MCCC 1A13808]
MYIRILGSAAGGGFPQWNCNCPNCRGVRKGTLNALPRTQSSIAVSADGVAWVLFNTSPDILTQLAANPDLQPARQLRDTAIKAIVFMDSQIDHTTGLLMLREGCPHEVYCTDMVYEDLTTGFPLFNMLKHWNGGINRFDIPLDGESFAIGGIEHLRFTAIPVSGKAPPYSPHRQDPHVGDNIGILVTDERSGKTLFYAPGLGQMTSLTLECMAAADCLLVDGTFWQEDEMAVAGLGDRKAADMGHLPQSGPQGMLNLLGSMSKPRKILIHINNTNPILDENSPQRMQVQAEGVEVAYDGMRIELN